MPQESAQPPVEESSQVRMILVVEDDTDIGSFLVQAILQETTYQAMLVSDGTQALKVTKDIKPNLLLLDYQLPRMTGIELYDQLHASKGLEDVPAILISARLPRAEIEKRQIIGMHKPLELDDLLQTIEKLLG